MTVFREWLPIFISLFACFVSLKTYLRNRDNLSVNVSSNLIPITSINLDDGQRIINDYGIYNLNVWIINPSNHDISIFDLRMADDAGHELHYLKTLQLNQFNSNLTESNLVGRTVVSYTDSQNDVFAMKIPDDNHQLIKAHSMVSLDLALMNPGEITGGLVLGKIAVSQSWFYKFKHRNDFGYVNEKEFQKFASSFEMSELQSTQVDSNT